MSDGGAFSIGFANAYRMMMDREERKRQEEDLRKSLEVMAGTNAPLPEDTTMRPTVVQTPTAPLPGQSGITTQPSAPVADVPPVQTQTTTADLPQKDPYKEGLKNIELAYREKMKNLAQIRDPRLAMQFVQQNMQERDIAKAEHNSAAFQSTLNEIMNNPNLTPAQRIGMAVKANSKFNAGFKVGDIIKMFEVEKGPQVVTPGSYVRQPDGSYVQMGTPSSQQLTPYQQERLRLQQEGLKTQEKTQNVPGFGNITNAQIMSLWNSAQPTESEREVFNPITGQKEIVKSRNPGKPETLALLKPYVDKIKGIIPQSNQQTADQSDLTMPLIKEGISALGEEKMRQKIAAKYGDEVAEEWIARARNWTEQEDLQ